MPDRSHWSQINHSDRSRRLTQDKVDAVTETWIAAAQHLQSTFLHQLTQLAQRVEDGADGYFGQNYDGSGRGASELTPVERAVVIREKATDLERRTLRAFFAVDRAFVSLANALSLVLEEDATGEALVIEQANEAGGFCINCARFGVQSVREKGRSSGRCPACRVYRQEHDGEDRPEELIRLHEARRQRTVTYDRHHNRRKFFRGSDVV